MLVVGTLYRLEQFFLVFLAQDFAAAFQLLDLDFDQCASGGVATHYGVSRRRPGEHKTRVVSLATHRVVSGAKGSADDHGDLWHHRIRHRIHHLGPSFDNPAPLRIASHHEAVDIVEKDQRDQILIAVHDEARCLLCRLGINHAAKFNSLASFVVGLLGVHFLIGDNAYGKPANARVSTDHGLAVFRLILIEAAAINDSRQHLLHVIRTRGRGIVDTINLLGGERRRFRLLAIPGRETAVTPFFDQRADARDAGFIRRLAIIHRAANRCMHRRAAQFFCRNLLPDGGLHQRGPSQEKAAAVGHQYVVAHDRQITAARDAHAHNGRDLGNAHRRHDRVIAKDTAKVIGVGKNIFLKRQENACRVDQINRGHAILHRNVLCPDNFLRSHGEEGASFHGGIVGDNHHQSSVNACQPSDHAGRWRSAPLFVHAECTVNAKFKECARVGQQANAFAGREASFGMLIFYGFGPAAFADLFFFITHLGNQVSHEAHVGFKARRSGIHF